MVNWTAQDLQLKNLQKDYEQYSSSTSNVQYWLNLEEQGRLTKIHIGTATSTKRIEHYALPSTEVGGTCLQRVYAIDSSVVTGHTTILGIWTQTMQDIVAPPISDITLSSSTTVEDQVVGVDIGTLATTGSNPGHGTITWTLTSTTLSGDKLRIGTGADADKLEVGPNAIGADDAGSYDAVIKATDELGGYREETFTITVTSNNITDINISASEIIYGSASGTDIGNLTCVGGVGDVNYSIQSNPSSLANIKITDTGSSTAVLEANTGGVTSSPGSYSLTIRATDSNTVPQTYDETFTISVLSAFTNLKALDLNATGVDPDFKNNYLQETSGLFNSYLTASTPFSLSMWFKTNTDPSPTDYKPVIFRNGGKKVTSLGNKKYFLPPTDNSAAYGVYALSSSTAYKGPWGTLDAIGLPKFEDTWGVSFWVKHDASNAVVNQDTKVFYAKGSGSNNNVRFDISFRISNNSTGAGFVSVFYTDSGNTNYEFRSASTTFTLGDWNHVTVSKTATTTGGVSSYATSDIDFYINGVQAATTAPSGTWEDLTWAAHYQNRRYLHLFNSGNTANTARVMPSIDEFSFWNKDISGDAATIYNSGVPTDLSGSSGLYGYYRLGDGDSAGDGTGTADTYQLLHDMSGTSGTTFDTQIVQNGFNGTMTSVVADHPSGDMQTDDGYGMGDGLAISLTDKYDSAGAYVASGGETSKIVISFDGFENDATKVLVYNNDVTDNNWKNLVIIYDNSLTDDKDRISLYLNGVELTPLGTPSITFTGNNNYFKNVSDTATNTTIGASGVDETSDINNTHAFQAELDSISLHSEALSSAMITELYNSGVPVSVLDETLASDHTKVEMWINFENESDNATTAQDETDNNKDITLVNMETGDYLTLTGSDSIYYNP